MKKTMIAIFSASMAIAPVAFADDSTPVQAPLTQEQAAKMRQDVQSLAEAFGIEVPKPAGATQPNQGAQTQSGQSNQPQTTSTDVTMAKVADRALDLASGLISSVASTVEKAAPRVWRIMIKQQYAKAAGDLLVPWGLFTIGLVFVLISRKKFPHTLSGCNDRDCGPCTIRVIVVGIPLAAMVITAIWGFISLSDSIKYVINPEFYAIRDLLLMILNKGQGLQ